MLLEHLLGSAVRRSLFVAAPRLACPSLLSSRPRNWLDKGGEGRKRWVTAACQLFATELAGPIKSNAGRRAAQTFSAQVRLADRYARHGAHLPRAALLSGAVSVGPEGRLQIH